jgi:hypothetical protein
MRAVLFLSLAVLGAVGCGGGDMSGMNNDGAIGCANDPRAMMYLPNMQQAGVGHLLTFVLQQSDPAPPARYNNTWTMKILNGAGAAVTGATMTATPYMPDHGHGTSVVPTITPAGDAYTVGPLYLYMAGLWQITLQAQSTAGNDSGVFQFCIPG